MLSWKCSGVSKRQRQRTRPSFCSFAKKDGNRRNEASVALDGTGTATSR